jgi:two-component system, NarL family, nitrate/nitrite response regulator NarL
VDKFFTATRLLIADDHPIVLDGICALLRDLDVDVVARCRNGEQVLAEVERTRPELLVLDVQMPGLTGLQVLRTLRQAGDRTPVILLTASLSSAEAIEAIQLGVNGLVLKESAPRQLLQCVESVRAGERWIDPEATERALAYATGQKNSYASDGPLTTRERDLVRLVTLGLRNKEIAAEMSITEGTVKMHLHNIYEKLGIGSRTELAMYARDHDIG